MRNLKRMMITGLCSFGIAWSRRNIQLTPQLSRNAELAGMGPPRPGFLQSRIPTGQGGRTSQSAARLGTAMGCRFSTRVRGRIQSRVQGKKPLSG